MSEESCALYRHFGTAGELLYVGVSLSPTDRTRTHRAEAPWFRDVRNITLDWFPSKRQAEIAEKAAIIAEQPMWNRQHNEAVIAQRSRWDEEREKHERLRKAVIAEMIVTVRVAVASSVGDGVILRWRWRDWSGESIPEGRRWRDSRIYSKAIQILTNWQLISPVYRMWRLDESMLSETARFYRQQVHPFLTHVRASASDTVDYWWDDFTREVPEWKRLAEDYR